MEDRTENTEARTGNGTRSEGQNPRSGDGAPAERGTSWISVVSGWLAALGAALVLGGILGGVILLGGGSGAAAEKSEIIRLMVTLVAAFLVGGYVAGRMAGRLGLKHGLLVALLSLVATVVLALVGAVAGIGLADNLNGVALPKQQDIHRSLDALISASGILALLLPFAGGAFGGAWGAKTGRKRP